MLDDSSPHPASASRMNLIQTSLPGVVIIEPRVFDDARGFFFESYHTERFAEMGIDVRFVQDNHARSARGTLRGLHYQLQQPQAKLCRVIQGEVFDVAVDIRRGSPTFGQWTGAILSEENKRQIFVPRGFAHGYFVLSQSADFLYKCDDFYRGDDAYGIAWNDPQINVAWPLDGFAESDLILADKDRTAPLLADVNPELLPVF